LDSNSNHEDLSQKSVDVVIPTFNETVKLVRAINSVKSQTVNVGRIFVVDDGSKSEVRNFLLQTYKSDDLVELVLKEHSGLPGVSRKLGIGLSTADWIAFLDADDYWQNNKLQAQFELVQKMNCSLVFSNAIMLDGENQSPYFEDSLFPTSIELRALLRSNSVINSSVLVRRDLLEEIGRYPDSAEVRGVEDYATWLRISTLAKFQGVAEPLVFYEVSPGSLSRVEKKITRIHAQEDFTNWLRGRVIKNPLLAPVFLTLVFYKAEVFLNRKIDEYRQKKSE
jgi:glycosyltransferase involved in cell wall biosynthesis